MLFKIQTVILIELEGTYDRPLTRDPNDTYDTSYTTRMAHFDFREDLCVFKSPLFGMTHFSVSNKFFAVTIGSSFCYFDY